MEEAPTLSTESAADTASTRTRLDLAAGLAAWLVFAAVAAVALLFYAAAGGSGAATSHGEIELLIGLAAAFWLVGAWMTICWWFEGRTRLWPLPLVLAPISAFLFIPLYLVFCSAAVRRVVLPRRPWSSQQAPHPRFLGLPLWGLPLAVGFWLLALFTSGIFLLLLFIRGVRRTVLPRRTPVS
jgi:hypothetical protein